MRTDYRSRIYARYASQFKDQSTTFDHTAAQRWGRAFDHFLRDWLPGNRDAAIVDLACGSGELLYFFKERGYTRVAGVDISPEQVALARQVVPDVTEGSVFEYLESRPGSFDLITGLDLIEHLTKDEVLRFLDGCVAALKPGGRVILQTPNADSPLFGTIRYGDFTHEVGFAPDCLGRLMQLCGLKRIEARETGPVAHGAKSIVRLALWKAIRVGLKTWNLAETGTAGSGVFTRVFLISGQK